MSFPADNPAVFPTAIKKANVPALSNRDGRLGEGEGDRIDTLENDGRVKLQAAPDLQDATLDLKIDDKQITVAFQSAAKEIVAITFDRNLLKREIADYALAIQTYHAAFRTALPPQIQRVDMARREAHNKGARKLQSLMHNGNIDMGLNAARCVFYLIANRLG